MMHETDAGKDKASREELSLRLTAYQKELDQLTTDFSELMAKKMQERTELVDLLKAENDAEKADALWKKYDNAGATFSRWITDYQDRIVELTKKIHETNDLLWKSQEEP